MREKIRNVIMSLSGLTPAEADLWITNLTINVREISLLTLRLAVIILYLFCLVEYTAICLLVTVVAFWLIQLELKVEALEKKLKDNKKDIKYDYNRGFDTSERDSILQQLRER